MAGKTYFERRAIRLALESYLIGQGWTNLTFDEGFMSEKTITVPLITIELVRPAKASLEMGGNPSKVYKRNIQVDCYMESEPRTMAVTDLIMDFIELTPVQIIDETTSVIGNLICFDNNTIISDVLPPVLVDPKLLRWRGVVKSVWEAQYFN